MFDDEDRQDYISKTKEIFSSMLRKVFEHKEGIMYINDKIKIAKYLKNIEIELNKNRKMLNYIWWWRGCFNGTLNKFKYEKGYLYIDYKCMIINEIFVYISPIPNFDLILLSIEGEERNDIKLQDYIWDNKYGKLDINRNSINIWNHQFYDEDEILHYKLPYNIILTAQFGVANSREIINIDELEINLNKVLLKQMTFSQFIDWYTLVLKKMENWVDRFHKYLIEYPMLGFKHDLGKQICNSIKYFSTINMEDTTYYRARKIDSNIPYGEEGMWNPNPCKYQVSEGRYNHFGKSFLYLASNKETAFKEINKETTDKCCIAEIYIKKLENILDLRRISSYEANSSMKYILMHYILVYTGMISQPCSNENIKNEYLVSRFLSDCIRKKGYVGIIFNSTKTLEGENIVIFRPEYLRKINYIRMKGQPYIWNKTI